MRPNVTSLSPVRLLAASGAGLILAVASPLAASAHVTIDPAQAEAGSYAVVTVKVPNESATASTSRVEVSLPTDTPFASVRYVPVAGWSTELVRETLPEPVEQDGLEITEAVTSVVWTAQPGSEIADGQLQQFELSLGPVPDVGSLELPATQTYTDGEVVEWVEEGDDAEYPAPVLYVGDAPADDHHGGAHSEDGAEAADTATTTGASAATSTSSPASSDDVLARVLAVGGLAVGIVGIALAVSARRTRQAG